MSQEAIDRIKRGYEAFNRGDLEAAVQDLHPDIEWRVALDLPDSPPDETYRGHEGVMRFWQSWHGAFEGFSVEIEEIIDAGDAVVVVGGVHGRGAVSGADVATPTFPMVWTLADDGRPIRVEMFQTLEDAKKEAGLG
jgi:ketosteroid isomerase-like protein